MSSISIIESSCPEATKEVSGAIERIIESIGFTKCPITLSGLCEYPGSCVGCYEIIDSYLEMLQ